jgi:hypothetical protein
LLAPQPLVGCDGSERERGAEEEEEEDEVVALREKRLLPDLARETEMRFAAGLADETLTWRCKVKVAKLFWLPPPLCSREVRATDTPVATLCSSIASIEGTAGIPSPPSAPVEVLGRRTSLVTFFTRQVEALLSAQERNVEPQRGWVPKREPVWYMQRVRVRVGVRVRVRRDRDRQRREGEDDQP